MVVSGEGCDLKGPPWPGVYRFPGVRQSTMAGLPASAWSYSSCFSAQGRPRYGAGKLQGLKLGEGWKTRADATLSPLASVVLCFENLLHLFFNN